MKDEDVAVKALNAPLEPIPANRRFALDIALDKTSINPDAPPLRGHTVKRGVPPLGEGRANIWTLMPVLTGDVRLLTSLPLQRCQSVPIDVAKYTSVIDVTIADTENAQQSEDRWTNFALEWLLRCGTSYDGLGVIYIDAHITHLTTSSINMATMHGVYIVV